mmetsp:Transcript_1896/g.2264  ORF Transcript_1896/g.2264 Transcript_1896/m.2264 type:complete len:605 (-) Transcript_1896:261-2075(-)
MESSKADQSHVYTSLTPKRSSISSTSSTSLSRNQKSPSVASNLSFQSITRKVSKVAASMSPPLKPRDRSNSIVPISAPIWRQQLGVFLLTYLSYCVLYSIRKPFSVVKANLQEELGISTVALGNIETAFLTTYALGQLVIPPLTQQIAEPPTVLLLAFLGSSACAFIFGSSSLPWWMGITWIVNGLFHAPCYPLLVRAVCPWFESSIRGRVLGSWTTSQQIGSLFATAFAGFTAEFLGWRLTFFIPGVLVGINAFFLYFFLPRGCAVGLDKEQVEQIQRPHGHSYGSAYNGSSVTEENKRLAMRVSFGGTDDARRMFTEQDGTSPVYKQNDQYDVTCEPVTDDRTHSCASSCSTKLAVAPPSGSLGRVAGQRCSVRSAKSTGRCRQPRGCHSLGPHVSVWQALMIPDMMIVALAFFCIKCVRYSLLCWLPFYLRVDCGYPKPLAAYSSTLFDVGGVLGAIFTGMVSDKILNGRRLFAARMMSLCAALSVILFSFTSKWGPWWTAFGMTSVGFCVAGPDSVLGAAAAQDLCERSKYGVRALVVSAGIVNGLGSSGASFQGWLVAHVSSQFGWKATYFMLGGFLTMAAFLLSFALRRETEQRAKLN